MGTNLTPTYFFVYLLSNCTFHLLLENGEHLNSIFRSNSLMRTLTHIKFKEVDNLKFEH